MNIEFIKSEFEKLTLILRSWKEDHNISAIERDIVLDKLKNIYDAVRFADADADTDTADTGTADSHTAAQSAQQPAAPAAAETAPAAPTTDADSDTSDKEEEQGDEVEVEFIFSDDDEQPEETSLEPTAADTTAEPAATAEAKNTAAASDDVVADLPTLPAEDHRTLAVTSTMPTEVTVSTDTTAQSVPQSEPASTADMEAAEQPIADTESQHDAEPHPAADTTHDTDEDSANAADNSHAHVYATSDDHDTEAHAARRPMHSLFGSDEVRQRQPSRHHRMMSIYDDAESKPEKVVDISKIDRNDNHDDETNDMPKRSHAAVSAADEGVTTIADAMSGSKHTLADTLTGPEPLAEQITHSATTSLRDAIGINDKFLLIRDLFAGDDHEYEKAIAKLDSFDNLDDCLIYIAENYAWNPNSEGAKFMMQLLERKLS
ncbi:MAG: hypothetical protein BHV65_05625 [Alistipes sp. 58_9_plus]|nr:MAG: hypothetical protein BHV65_05625 [Alistipes sp. 58_9_plus]